MLLKNKLQIAIRKNVRDRSDVHITVLHDCSASKIYLNERFDFTNSLKIKYIVIFREIIKKLRWSYGI